MKVFAKQLQSMPEFAAVFKVNKDDIREPLRYKSLFYIKT
jgi:hypothetical protein